jgi:hypothetical protein
MARVRHTWREACALALRESDPRKFFSRIEYALTILERRYAECEFDPLTPAEMTAIRKTIHALEQAMQEKLSAVPVVDPHEKKRPAVTTDAISRELVHIKHLLHIVRP